MINLSMKPIAFFAVGAVALVMGILFPTSMASGYVKFMMYGIGVALLGVAAFFATGHNFGGSRAAVATRDPMRVASSAALSRKRVCRSCGAEIPQNASVCPKCGQ